MICKDLYNDSCNWFMWDGTTFDCKLFSGSLSDLEDDCNESGNAVHPSYSECKAVMIKEHEGCYVSLKSNFIVK